MLHHSSVQNFPEAFAIFPGTLFPQMAVGCSLTFFRSLLQYHHLVRLSLSVLKVILKRHAPRLPCQQLEFLAPFYFPS